MADTTPLEPPADLTAAVSDSAVVLGWTPSDSDDASGVEVWRDSGSGMERVAVVYDLATYRDAAVTEGRTYT